MIIRGIRHLGWADERFFTTLGDLPDGAFAVSYAPGTMPVGQLAAHIVGGAEWYRYCLTGELWTDLQPATTGAEVLALRDHLRGLDATLMAEASAPDAPVTFRDEEGERTVLRSTLLLQAIVHSTEHRAQISSALAANGVTGPSLDDLDLWAFEAWERAAG